MELQTEAQRVLANFIAEAAAPIGQLPPGALASEWIAQRFVAWWSSQVWDVRVQGELADAVNAVEAIRTELERLGGWSNPELGDALHEVIHAQDALNGLRACLGASPADGDAPVPRDGGAAGAGD